MVEYIDVCEIKPILRGFSGDQIEQIFLKSLLEFMVPPDIRDAVEHGYTISVHEQLGILASKIRDVVVRCCDSAEGAAKVSEEMLAEICHYFRSGLTEHTLSVLTEHDLVHILDDLERAEREGLEEISTRRVGFGVRILTRRPRRSSGCRT